VFKYAHVALAGAAMGFVVSDAGRGSPDGAGRGSIWGRRAASASGRLLFNRAVFRRFHPEGARGRMYWGCAHHAQRYDGGTV